MTIYTQFFQVILYNGMAWLNPHTWSSITFSFANIDTVLSFLEMVTLPLEAMVDKGNAGKTGQECWVMAVHVTESG